MVMCYIIYSYSRWMDMRGATMGRNRFWKKRIGDGPQILMLKKILMLRVKKMIQVHNRMKLGKINAVILAMIVMVNFSATPILAIEIGDAVAKYTNVTLKIDGNVVDTDNTEPLEQDETISLTYDFEVLNSGSIDVGDTVTTTVPVGFLIANPVSNIIVGNGTENIGTFDLAMDRTLTLTFNADVRNSVGWVGQIVLNSEFELEALPSDNNPVEFVFSVNDAVTKTLNLKFAPGGSTSAIKKEGEPYRNGTAATKNPDAIQWDIEVNNNLESINAIVEDTIPAGLEITGDVGNDYNVIVYNRKVDLGGNATDDGALDNSNYTVTYDTGTSKLTVDLGDITSAYRITFPTDIVEANWSQLSFNNTGVLKDLATSEATVSFTRGDKISKIGSLDRAFNPREVNWTIDINEFGQSLTAGTVVDVIPDGLTLKDLSLVYSTLTFDADGKITLITPGAVISMNQVDDELTFTLPVNTTSAYRIFYTTTIDATSDATFNNTATLKDAGVDEDSDSASEEANFGELLSKDGISNIGYGSANHKLDWTIDVNTVESIITNGVLTDVIPAGLTLDVGSIIISKLNIADNGNITKGDALVYNEAFTPALTYVGKTITLDLNELRDDNGGGSLNYAFRIKYITTLDDEDVQGTFTNDVTLTGTSDAGAGGPIGGAAASITKSASPNVSFDNNIVKAFKSIDYSAKTMTWKIKLRPLKEPMTGLVITDTFKNDGLTFLPGTVTVTDGLAHTLGFVDTDNDGNTVINYSDGFVMTFTETIPSDKEYIIEYKTSFDRLTHDDTKNLLEYKNKANAAWGENGDPDTNSDLNNNAIATINSPAGDNGNKSGQAVNRTDKTIDWEINANYLSETYTNYTLSDTIPDDNVGNVHYHQALVQDSIKVYKYTINASGNKSADGVELVEGLNDGDYTIVSITEIGFEIGINGSIDYPVRVKYTTKLINDSVNTYSNTAVLNGDRSVSASVSHDDYDAFASKSYIYTSNQAKIDWTVEVNESLSSINNGKLVDTLSVGHEFDPSSIEVLKQPGDQAVDAGEYSVNIETIDIATGQERMTLSFTSLIDDQYTINYITNIFVDTNQTISNNASFSGDGIVSYDDADDEEQAIAITAGYAAALATREADNPKIDITITKVDGDNALKLEDAIYEVYDADMNIVSTFAATDTNGIAKITRLDEATYYLKEKVAPMGYQLPDPNLVEVDPNEGGFDGSFTLENYKFRSVKIIKVAESDNELKLQNATFDLHGPIGKATEITVRITTDVDGIAVLENLLFGEYTITEVSAPSGYRLNATPLEITIDDSMMVFESIIENKKRSFGGSNPDPEPEVIPEPEVTPEPELVPPVEEPKYEKEPIPETEVPEVPEEIIYKPNKDVEKTEVKVPPTKGTVEIKEDGTIIYTPGPEFDGSDKIVLIITTLDGVEEEFIIDIFEEMPLAGLPETGGLPMNVYVTIGGVLVGVGIKFKGFGKKK